MITVDKTKTLSDTSLENGTARSNKITCLNKKIKSKMSDVI